MIAYKTAATLIVAAASGMGVVAQIPTHDAAGDYSKYGVIGVLAVVIMGLLYHTIPKMLDNHTENSKRIADEVKTGMSEVRESIEKGNERNATLLQSALVQAFKVNRENDSK